LNSRHKTRSNQLSESNKKDPTQKGTPNFDYTTICVSTRVPHRMNFNEEQQHLHPIVVAVDGCEWDIRNLCVVVNQEEQIYPRNSGVFSRRRSDDAFQHSSPHPGGLFSRRRSEVSDGFKAYPSMKDIPESLNVDDVFDKLNALRQLEKADRASGNCNYNSSRNTTPTSPSRYRSDNKSAGATYRNEHQRPGVTWNSHPRHEEDHKQDHKQEHVPLHSKSSQREFYNGRQREDEQPSNPAGGGDNNIADANLNRTMVEVMPGEYVPLRGSVETWDAVMSGQVKKTACACCCLDLVCVQDADLVMCPGCRIISPADDGGDMQQSGGGLGLGMSVQDARYELSQRGLSDLARRFR
jgi:hypothetical protein